MELICESLGLIDAAICLPKTDGSFETQELFFVLHTKLFVGSLSGLQSLSSKHHPLHLCVIKSHEFDIH